MKRTRVGIAVAWASSLFLGACVQGGGPAGADAAGPGVTVNIAALNLAGVGDIVWDLEVANGGGAVVWQRRITSSAYGDGAGSASYVAPCDADPAVSTNAVKLWVVGVYGGPVSAADAGSFNATHDGVVGTQLDFQDPTATAPLQQSVACLPNADVAVRFDVSLMRPARQGFFDIAVSFSDVFCAAKLDCCHDATGNGCDGTEDIALLFDASGQRARTFVLGFACTAGADASAETTLYLDPLELDCSDPNSGTDFSADIVLDPSAGPGNLCPAGALATCPAVLAGGVVVDDYLFQAAVFRGEEQLTSGGVDAQKVYWNIALGVKSPAIAGCRLRTRGTAGSAASASLANGVIAAGAVYPYVRWDAALDETCASEGLTFGVATAPVTTAYTGVSDGATAFVYGFGPTAPTCDDGVANGAETDVDCGGPLCATCTGGLSCLDDTDCASASCNAGACAANYWGDGSDGALATAGNVLLPAATDGDVVVRQYSALTINAGHTLTLQNRAKGLVIYVDGDAIINGTLSMTARGANVDPVVAGVPATGLRFVRFTPGGGDTLAASDVGGAGASLAGVEAEQPGASGNGTVFNIARAGAAGAGATTVPSDGAAGQSGGGGAGDAQCGSGAGTAGTCFSGGSGGASGCVQPGQQAQLNGGRGGLGGTGFAGLCSWNSSGGGAGNPGGAGSGCGAAGGTGTGGLLVLMVRGNLTLGPSGVIAADGAKGGDSATGMRDRQEGGGGSGGGTILVLHAGDLANAGQVHASGGAGGFGSVVNVYGGGPGGRGGNGSVRVVQILE